MNPASNPYAAPVAGHFPHAAPGAHGLRPYYAALNGDVLVVQKDAALPDVCMKCGTQHGIVRRSAKFQWTPVWARLMLVLCTVPGVIAMLVTTKKAPMQIPLCAPCNARWGQAVAALVVGIVALVGAVLSLRVLDDSGVGGIGFFVVLAGFFALAIGFVRPRMLQAHKIDERNVELKGVHPSAAQTILGG